MSTEPTDPTVLAVIDVGTTIDQAGTEWPTAVVDAEGYPEINELAKVHDDDDLGDLRTEAMCLPFEDGHVFLIGVRVTTPVVCAFALTFSLPAHRPFLEDAAAAGQLLIATTAPEGAATERPTWLALNLDEASVRSALP